MPFIVEEAANKGSWLLDSVVRSEERLNRLAEKLNKLNGNVTARLDEVEKKLGTKQGDYAIFYWRTMNVLKKVFFK